MTPNDIRDRLSRIDGKIVMQRLQSAGKGLRAGFNRVARFCDDHDEAVARVVATLVVGTVLYAGWRGVSWAWRGASAAIAENNRRIEVARKDFVEGVAGRAYECPTGAQPQAVCVDFSVEGQTATIRMDGDTLYQSLVKNPYRLSSAGDQLKAILAESPKVPGDDLAEIKKKLAARPPAP